MNIRLLDDGTGVDEDTARWLLDEAAAAGDATLAGHCERALGGDRAAVAIIERVLEQRVADAHEARRREDERRQRARERRLGEQMGAVTLAMHAGGGS